MCRTKCQLCYVDTLTDIENAIRYSPLSQKQRKRLDYWMAGYSSKQIADKDKSSERGINQSILSACRQIELRLKGD